MVQALQFRSMIMLALERRINSLIHCISLNKYRLPRISLLLQQMVEAQPLAVMQTPPVVEHHYR
jgi:hypothetical protein